jgi:hypothetical protein
MTILFVEKLLKISSQQQISKPAINVCSTYELYTLLLFRLYSMLVAARLDIPGLTGYSPGIVNPNI